MPACFTRTDFTLLGDFVPFGLRMHADLLVLGRGEDEFVLRSFKAEGGEARGRNRSTMVGGGVVIAAVDDFLPGRQA